MKIRILETNNYPCHLSGLHIHVKAGTELEISSIIEEEHDKELTLYFAMYGDFKLYFFDDEFVEVQ